VYNFEIKTSGEGNSETGPDVNIEFKVGGTDYETIPFSLTDVFNKWEVKSFSVGLMDLGEITSLEITTDSDDGWQFDYIKIERDDSAVTFYNGYANLDDGEDSGPGINLNPMIFSGDFHFLLFSFQECLTLTSHIFFTS